MKVEGIKSAGFSSEKRTSRRTAIEMTSGTETVSRRGDALEYTTALRCEMGTIRLTLGETEMCDWHMRLGRALKMNEEKKP